MFKNPLLSPTILARSIIVWFTWGIFWRKWIKPPNFHKVFYVRWFGVWLLIEKIQRCQFFITYGRIFLCLFWNTHLRIPKLHELLNHQTFHLENLKVNFVRVTNIGFQNLPLFIAGNTSENLVLHQKLLEYEFSYFRFYLPYVLRQNGSLFTLELNTFRHEPHQHLIPIFREHIKFGIHINLTINKPFLNIGYTWEHNFHLFTENNKPCLLLQGVLHD